MEQEAKVKTNDQFWEACQQVRKQASIRGWGIYYLVLFGVPQLFMQGRVEEVWWCLQQGCPVSWVPGGDSQGRSCLMVALQGGHHG